MKAFRVVASANQQRAAAVSGPTPKRDNSSGAVITNRASIRWSSSAISSSSDWILRANELSDILWAAITGSPDRDARNRDASLTKTETVRPFNRQRSWSGAVITR